MLQIKHDFINIKKNLNQLYKRVYVCKIGIMYVHHLQFEQISLILR